MSASDDYWHVTATPTDVWAATPGTSTSEKFANVPGNHSPLFAPDPSAVLPGVQALISAALSRLAERQGVLRHGRTGPQGARGGGDGRRPRGHPLVRTGAVMGARRALSRG